MHICWEHIPVMLGEGGAGCVQDGVGVSMDAVTAGMEQGGNHPFSGKETPPCRMVFIHSALISYGK